MPNYKNNFKPRKNYRFQARFYDLDADNLEYLKTVLKSRGIMFSVEIKNRMFQIIQNENQKNNK